MKVRFYERLSSVLVTLTLLASPLCIFAQKYKYLPEIVEGSQAVKATQNAVRNAAPKTVVPYVVNPHLPRNVQENVTHFSGVAVERAQAQHAAKSYLPASAQTAKPFTLSSSSTHAGVTASLPAVHDMGTNLTGMQVVATYFPTWRQELGGMFSKEQLDAVEKAFSATDEWLFVRDENGDLQIRNKDEWDYEARFLTLLQNSGVSFTEKQIKQLVGGPSIQGFTFTIYFSRMKATGFRCAKGRKPRSGIWRNGHKLSRKEITPEEIQEVIIGRKLDNLRNHPLVQAYMQENRLYAENKTPEEYVTLARQYLSKPRSQIWRNGHILSREEMTPEEVQEVIVGSGLNRYRNHPLVQAYMQENRLHAKPKTPEEYVALAQQYSTKPRTGIYRNGHILSREEMTPEEVQEVNIGQGLNTYRNHPLVQAYMQGNRLKAKPKTPEEYVALARQYSTKPRSQIKRNGHVIPREQMTSEEIQEVNIGMGLNTHRNHPAVIAYMQENRLRAEAKTTEQLYTALVDHIKDYGHYPLWNESSLYRHIYNRLYRYQSTMVDGKYQDPWLQKIYELKTAVQNAPEGKFTLTPDGQGGYILEIEEPATEELDVTAPQPVEEVAPAVPSPHTIRLRINEETKNLVLATRDHAALERREFPGWLRSMHRAENFPQIVGQNTFDALHVLNRAINFDYRNRMNRRAVTRLLATVNNYVGLLGEQPELGTFYKLIYRGQVEPGILPQADKFHVVAETQGLSWDGALAPQLEKVNRAYAQEIKRGETPGVYLDGDEEMATALGIEGRVDIRIVKQDLENTIANLLPPGYTVRMGVHELGISESNLEKFQKGYVHIHLENTSGAADEDGLQIDHSISLDIKAGRFAGWWDAKARQFYPFSNAKIAQNYRLLFDSFLDQEAKDKLDTLAR